MKIIDTQVSDGKLALSTRPSSFTARNATYLKRKKKVQRCLSDCSLGQHYHVFFHKRRFSYGSPICGFLSLFVYAALLFYVIIKLIGIFTISNYVNVELYNPINFKGNNITIGNFLQKIELEIVFDMQLNDSTTWFCPNLEQIALLRADNPPMYLPLSVSFDLKAF